MPPKQKVKVLLVDDRPENLLALETILEDLNLYLVKAHSGKEALKQVLLHDFALILLDVRMPEMDGFETATLIRGSKRTKNITIIFITAAYTTKADVSRGYSLGAVDYLIKPLLREQVRSKVMAYVELFQKNEILKEKLKKVSRAEEKVNILLVDDNLKNLLAIKEVLAPLGENLFKAQSGKEALHLVGKNDIDLILMDVHMPEMDGFETAMQLKQYERLREIPIIFMSAIRNAAEDISQGYSLGAVDYIFSPYDPEMMRTKIQSLVALIKNTKLLERNLKKIEELNQKLVNSKAALQNLNKTLERRVAEQTKELLKGEAKYRTLFNDSKDAIFINTKKGKLIDFNQSFIDLFGYSRKELLEFNVRETYAHPDDRFRFQKEVGEKGFIRDYELKLKKKDRKEIDCLITATLWRAEDGTILGYQGIIRDISERKQMEEDRRKLEMKLQQAQKMEAIGTLAGGIAHDFNNILTAIIGFTEMASLDIPKEDQAQKSLNQVLQAGYRAKDLVQQILTFSRHTEETKKPLEVVPIVKEALRLLRALLPTTIEIRQNITANKNTTLGNPSQIHQIVMNLCTNAFHAMAEKGGVLEVGITNVDLDSNEVIKYPDIKPGPYLRLTVKDTGHGMEPKVRESIFDPYFTTKEKGVGTGLGLSVVHGIVKSYGGAISVYSEPGKGSVFHIYLPLVEEEAKVKPEMPEPLPTGHGRVLFVDDEEAIAKLGKRMLEYLGYDVATTTKSIEALELFKAQPDRFDLVITDMTMPQMTGENLAQELMKIRPDIPVILCSGYSEVISDKRALEIGIREFVMKPHRLKDLASTVRRVLGERK